MVIEALRFNTYVKRISILTFGHILGMLPLGMLLALAPMVQIYYGLDQSQFGFLIAAYYGVQVIFALPSGILVDRVGIRSTLLLSSFIGIAALVFLTLGSTFTQILPVFIVLGISYSMLNPATSKAIVDWIPFSSRAFAMGTKQSGVPLGGVCASLIILISAGLSWHSKLWIIVIIVALGALLYFQLPRDIKNLKNKSRKFSVKSIYLLIKNKELLIISIINSFYNIGQIGLWSFCTLYFTNKLQTSAYTATIAFGVLHGASIIGRILWGRVSDYRFNSNRKPVVIIIGVLATVSFILLSFVNNVSLAFLLMALLGMTIGGYAGVLQTMSIETVDSNLAATAIGFNMLLVPMGAMLAPILFSFMVTWGGGYYAGWLSLAFITGLSSMLLVMIK